MQSQEPTAADYITLSQAARLAPGRPSTCAVWRWSRRGVIARDGQRIRLRHVRSGGRLMTTARWVAEFCTQLAERDATHFDARLGATARTPPREPRYAPPSRRRTDARAKLSNQERAPERHNDTEDELEREGL